MQPDSIELVFFDLVGTTVRDRFRGSSLVLEVMKEAFLQEGLRITDEVVRGVRGKSKYEAINEIVEVHFPQEIGREVTDRIYNNFLTGLESKLDCFEGVEGVEDVFRFLKFKGYRVVVGSGFPTKIVNAVMNKMGWTEKGIVDRAVSYDTIGKGRPDPGLILYLMELYNIKNTNRVVKVGDTVADILEGKNAGARTVAVLAGTQPAEKIEEAGPDFIVSDITEIKRLFV